MIAYLIGGVLHCKVTWGGDVPPARVYFFKFPSLAMVYFMAILVHLVSLGKRVCFLAILVDFSLGKGMLFVWQFWSKKCQTL